LILDFFLQEQWHVLFSADFVSESDGFIPTPPKAELLLKNQVGFRWVGGTNTKILA